MLLFKVSSRNFQPCHTTSCNSCLLFYYYFNAILILFYYHFNAIIMLFYCHFIEGTWGKVPGSIANISEGFTHSRIRRFWICRRGLADAGICGFEDSGIRLGIMPNIA